MTPKKRTAPSQVPQEVFTTRRKNLLRLIEEKGGMKAGGMTRLSIELGYANASRLSQLASGVDEISERVARSIEGKLGLSDYWMDDPTHSGGPLLDTELLMACVQKVLEVVQRMHAAVAPDKQVEVARLLYEDARARGEVNTDFAERLVKLLG